MRMRHLRRHRSSRASRAAAVLLVLALAAAACGGDDPADDSAAAAQAEAQAAEAQAAADAAAAQAAEAQAAEAQAAADAAAAQAELEAAQAELDRVRSDAATTEEDLAAAEQRAEEAAAAADATGDALAAAEQAAEEAAAAAAEIIPADLPYGLTPGKPYDGTELTFLICCPGAAQFQVWRASRPEFERLTGISVDFTDDPLGGLREKIVTESVASPGSWDVTILFDVWLPELSSFLAPLDPDVASDVDLDDFPAATADLGAWEGAQFGIPVRSHVMMFYYRADVFEEMGLEVPTTLDELLETARVIDEADNGMAGFTLNWAKQASISPIPWQQFVKSGGGAVFDESGAPAFNSPEAVRATEVYQQLLDYAPAGAAAYNEADMRNSFARGEAAMTIAWSWSMEIFQRPDIADASVVGNVGFTADIPGIGGTVGPLAMAWPMAISDSSENKGAAAEWVRWMTNPDLDRQAISEKSINGQATVVGNRISSLESAEANAPEANNGFSQAMADAYKSATHQPIYPKFSTVTEIIETALSEIVSGADVAATLDRAAQEAAAAL